MPSAPALVRGVLPRALGVNDQVRVTTGRFPNQPGEIMVGALVPTNLGVSPERLAIGQSLVFEGTPWKIVGQFTAPGTAFESEIWGPLDDLMVAARRSELSSIVLRAKDAAALKEVLFDFATRSDVLVEARQETAYYAAYAEAFRPVQFMVYVMTGMLVLGGMFVGMNTLFAAVMSRIREIGVLRTVGYRRWHIALAFLIESLDPGSHWRHACLPACAWPERIRPAHPHGRIPIRDRTVSARRRDGIKHADWNFRRGLAALALSAPQNRGCHPASLKPREGEKMKAIISTLIAAICAASAVIAQDKPALTGVDSLAAKPSDYTGKIVAVLGVVERVSEAKKMFTLVDASEAGCADACQRAMIVAQLGQGVTTLPKAMEPVIAIGKVDTFFPAMRVTVTELVLSKEAVDARLKQLSAK